MKNLKVRGGGGRTSLNVVCAAICAAQSLCAATCIVSGDVSRESSSSSSATISADVRPCCFAETSVSPTASEPFECRSLSFCFSNVLASLCCDLPGMLLILR